MLRATRSLLPSLACVLWLGCSSTPRGDGSSPDDAGDATTMVDVSPDAAPGDQSPVDTNPPADMSPVDVSATDVTATDATPDDVVATDAPTVDVDTADSIVDAPDSAVRDVAPIDVASDVTDAGVRDVVDVPTTVDRLDAADVVDATACVPTTESCNGRDDDCDGLVDESSCGTHLLVTEVVVAPTEAEFIEVHNPTATAVNLASYYLSDMHDYACLLGRTCTIATRPVATLETSDFVVRFPDGATIAPGGFVVVSLASPADFAGINGGHCPDFYVPSHAVLGDAGTAPPGPCTAARPMRPSPASTSTIGSTAGLGNGGELVMLFRWDGAAALATDVDYMFWGAPSTTNPQVDKTGTSVMGTMFHADTAAGMQQRVAAPATGAAAIRCDFAESGERRTGGNGVDGHDETSEPVATTWRTTSPPARTDGGLLTSVTATPGALNDCR